MNVTQKQARPSFDRSQVAQHNDEARGHWLIIEGFVYDVTELMRTHPGGARILQLYAGRDATAGFRRVHQGRAQVELMLARARLGPVRELECSTHPGHAAHRAASRALHAALALAVEMQNALKVDHAFQLLPLHGTLEVAANLRRSRYELQRGLETHVRFHREYLDVLTGASLSALASSILTPQAERGWRARLEHLQGSQPYTDARAGVLALLERLEDFTDHELTVSVSCFEVLDGWLMRTWKRELTRAVRTLECSHPATLQLSDATSVYKLCDRLVEGLHEYFRNACSITHGPSLGNLDRITRSGS